MSVVFFQYMTAAAAAAPMQGTYIPQYTPVPPTAVPVEVRLFLPMKNNLCAYPIENIITPDSPISHTHEPPIQPFLNLLGTSADQKIH